MRVDFNKKLSTAFAISLLWAGLLHGNDLNFPHCVPPRDSEPSDVNSQINDLQSILKSSVDEFCKNPFKAICESADVSDYDKKLSEAAHLAWDKIALQYELGKTKLEDLTHAKLEEEQISAIYVSYIRELTNRISPSKQNWEEVKNALKTAISASTLLKDSDKKAFKDILEKSKVFDPSAYLDSGCSGPKPEDGAGWLYLIFGDGLKYNGKNLRCGTYSAAILCPQSIGPEGDVFTVAHELSHSFGPLVFPKDYDEYTKCRAKDGTVLQLNEDLADTWAAEAIAVMLEKSVNRADGLKMLQSFVRVPCRGLNAGTGWAGNGDHSPKEFRFGRTIGRNPKILKYFKCDQVPKDQIACGF